MASIFSSAKRFQMVQRNFILRSLKQVSGHTYRPMLISDSQAGFQLLRMLIRGFLCLQSEDVKFVCVLRMAVCPFLCTATATGTLHAGKFRKAGRATGRALHPRR